MTYTRIIALSALLTSVSAIGLQAQTPGDASMPAELPPSSFTGSQYVDSQGCVFNRASIDGTTAWVPRVNRDRTPVCDQPPTFATALAETTVEPSGATQVASSDTTLAAQGAPMATVASSIVDTPAAAPTPVPAPRAAAPAAVVAAPAPRRPVVATPTPTRIAQAQPQSRRILPAHLVDSRTAARLVRVPKGFELVWDDGRLNPRRGEQSIQGYINSQSTMSHTVPRRDVGGAGPSRVVEPRILSENPVQVSPVRVEYEADRR